ncbi:MAG: alpha/beta fold hydrolase [bacterium]
MPLILSIILLAFLFLLSVSIMVIILGPLLMLQPRLRTRQWYSTFTRLLEPNDAGLPQEDITITTKDGIILDGWLVRNPRGKGGTVIYLHGIGDCKIGGVPYAKLFYDMGFHVFLYDSRRHGKSGGSYCTFGFYEKHDLSTVIDFLTGRKDFQAGKIGVFGTSMGAAIALQAAALDTRIEAIIAEAGFTDLRTITVDYQKRIIKLPWHFLRNLAMIRSQRMAKFKARLVTPLQAVKEVHKPILFIHGTDDSRIRAEYSQALFENANEPKELILIPKGNHTDLLNVGGSEYEERITSFFEHHLRPA